MNPENSLNVDLDSRVKTSPRFKSDTVGDYFKYSKLDWWKPTSQEYTDQENIIETWLENRFFKRGLEIGPGFGRITDIISPHTDQLTLLEINQKAIKYLHQKFPLTTLVDGNVNNFDLWKGKFDLIAAVEILVHIPDISSLLDVVSESLNEEGVFITSITPKEKYGHKYTVIHRGIDPDEFENSLLSRGLQISKRTQTGNHINYEITKYPAFAGQ